MLARRSKTLSPGSRIRVLVVDDSATVRSIVTRTLRDDPLIEVVGTAANGSIGLAKSEQLRPDVVTLDIEMPEMGGLEMLKKLRSVNADVVVIMISTLTAPGAAQTLDALMLGADDYITKPSHCGTLEQCIAVLGTELVPKIKQFFAVVEKPCVPRSSFSRLAVDSHKPAARPEVLAIGVSTGGPQALSAIIPRFPATFPWPVLIVQHMPPMFTRLLAERLQSITPLHVEEATETSAVHPGRILIAPGGFHMRVKKSGNRKVAIVLDQSPPRNSCRPSVDVLFESVNEVYGGAAIAAILTGMGQDGLHGAELLKASGAYIVAQDEASSVVWGMPGFVARSGLADAVIPLQTVVPHILKKFDPGLEAVGWEK